MCSISGAENEIEIEREREREREREVRTFTPPCGLWVEELEMGLGLSYLLAHL
jgi:hypothetical protein